MIRLRIKDIAKEKGLKLNDLAVEIGVAQPSISRMVNGVIMPSWDTLERIAEALDVEPYELFDNAPRKDVERGPLTCPHCHGTIDITINK